MSEEPGTAAGVPASVRVTVEAGDRRAYVVVVTHETFTPKLLESAKLRDEYGVLYLQWLSKGNQTTFILWWRSREDFEAKTSALWDAMGIPAAARVTESFYVDGRYPEVSLAARAGRAIRKPWLVLTTLGTLLGLLWAFYSEHYPHFLARPRVRLIPLQAESKQAGPHEAIEASFDISNENTAAAAVVVIAIQGEQLVLPEGSGRSVHKLEVGDTRRITVHATTNKAGPAALVVHAESWSGVLMDKGEETRRLAIEVFQSVEILKPLSVQNGATSGECTLRSVVRFGESPPSGWGIKVVSRRKDVHLESGYTFEGDRTSGEPVRGPANEVVEWVATVMPRFKEIDVYIKLRVRDGVTGVNWTDVARDLAKNVTITPQ